MVIVYKVLPSLWLLFLSTVYSYKVETNPNVTTLYPIENRTATNNETDILRLNPETRSSTKNQQIWTLESGFAESNITEDASEEKEHKTLENLKENELKPNSNKAKNEHKEVLEGFKPSQHLGSFFNEDSAEVIRTPSLGLIGRKPSSGFINSHREEGLLSFNKKPYNSFHHTHKPFPYKFEDPIFTKAKEWDSIESRPTVESPVRVPAGGLYQSPDAFKDGPLSGEEYGLEAIEDGKDHSMKKRVNPWQDLLRLATAFIPVGLIISALTPNVITLQNVDAPAPNPYRRSDVAVPNMSPISESCRRRLLCEIHSERNYTPNSSSRAKHCYKLHCEDTEALWKVLRWMFTYNQGPKKAKFFT